MSPRHALADLDDTVECLEASLNTLDHRITRLRWAIAGWGLVLTAEVLLRAGVVWWWGG
jgi:hypothetical protein